MKDTVTIVSDDQSMWTTGDAPGLDWEKYLPLIGGDMTDWTPKSVEVLAGSVDKDGHQISDRVRGTAVIVGDEVIYSPGTGVWAGGLSTEETVTLRIELESEPDDKGHVETMTRDVDITLEQTKGAKHGHLWKTKYDSDVTAMRSDDADASVVAKDGETIQLKFDAAGVEQKLNSQTSFTGDTPLQIIDIDFNLAESLKEVAQDALDGVANVGKKIFNFVKGVGEAIVDSAVVQKAAEAVAWTGEKLQDAWDFAKDKVPVLRDIEDGLETIGKGVVNAAKGAVHAAESAISSAIHVVDDLLDLSKKQVSKIVDVIEDGWSFFTGFFKKIVHKAVDTVRGLTDDERHDLNDAKKDIKHAEKDKDKAEKALDALNKYKDFLKHDSISDKKDEAAKAEEERQKKMDELKAIFSGKDGEKFRDALDKVEHKIDKASEAKLSKDKTADHFFDDALDFAKKFNPVDFVSNVIENSNLELMAKAAVEAKAQAGILLSAKIDSGSVDSVLVYDVKHGVVRDAVADTVTFTADATNIDTGIAPFTTQSPYAVFAIDLLYNIFGSIALDFDVNAKVGGDVVVDVPDGSDPFHWSQKVTVAGSKNVFELDTRDLEIQLIPDQLSEIVTLTVRWPVITTQGSKATEYFDENDPEKPITFGQFVAQAFDDPDSTDIDAMADKLLDLIKPKIGFSDGLQKLIDDTGNAIDSEADLGPALLSALKVVAGALVDVEMQKGDGSPYGSITPNPYKESDGYMPIFSIKNENAGDDGLIHFDIIDNPTYDGDLTMLEKLGFFTSSGRTEVDGEPANFIDLEVDVDELIFTLLAIINGIPPEEAENPLVRSFGLEDIFGPKDDEGKGGEEADAGTTKDDSKDSDPLDEASIDAMKEKYNFETTLEVADLKVNAGTYFSQKFALAVDDMEYKLFVEGDEVGSFKASGGGSFTLPDASSYVDKDGNGQVDYELQLVPTAQFFNDTQLGLNLGYQFDLLKAKAEVLATVPTDILKGALDFLDLPSKVAVEAALGPLLRMEADVDLMSIDIFESLFDFNAGFGSITGVLPEIPTGPVMILLGTEDDFLSNAFSTADLFGGSWYFEMTSKAGQTWTEARDAALKEGGVLLQIDSPEENAYVAKTFGPTSDAPIWIGATDVAEDGTYLDMNGNPFAVEFDNWSPGEPNDYHRLEPYVAMQGDGGWNDVTLAHSATMRTVIEFDLATMPMWSRDSNDSGSEDASGTQFDDWLIGTNAANVLDGKDGDDLLRGEGGNDTLLGGRGADTLAGGKGDDLLEGGADADRFAFSGAFGTDTITDFSGSGTGGEHDVIDLKAVDWALGLEVNLEFASLLLTQVGVDLRIELDTDRDGHADAWDLDGDGKDDAVAIMLLNTERGSITASDFLL